VEGWACSAIWRKKGGKTLKKKKNPVSCYQREKSLNIGNSIWSEEERTCSLNGPHVGFLVA
jgi:hypothetical protein